MYIHIVSFADYIFRNKFSAPYLYVTMATKKITIEHKVDNYKYHYFPFQTAYMKTYLIGYFEIFLGLSSYYMLNPCKISGGVDDLVFSVFGNPFLHV